MSVDGLQRSGVERPADDAEADRRARMIDNWFPCASVDAAVGTPAGSGRSEKALFTWFASRPIAQARAAVLTALLPDSSSLRELVRRAIEDGDATVIRELSAVVAAQYPKGRPVVLDVFSGRGIIPLEAARLGVTAVGTDLSPVATLGGRLLADYTLRDWSHEPELPFKTPTKTSPELFNQAEPRLLRDVRSIIAEIDRRTAADVEPYYPRAADGRFPWAYLWALTIPCDQCKRRFPLLGSLNLRYPYKRTGDLGQSLSLTTEGDRWHIHITEGSSNQQPTFKAADGRRGKSAQCPFCGHSHSLDTVKALGRDGQYQDALVAVAEELAGARKVFRLPTETELEALRAVEQIEHGQTGPLSAVPDELIPAGNNHTVRASAYGYRSYGRLMNSRQTAKMVATIANIRGIHRELLAAKLSTDYATALTAYAAANIPRLIRCSTRGARLRSHGNPGGSAQNRVQVDHVFADESKVSFGFDYLEAGPGAGPGTWESVAGSGLNALRKIIAESQDVAPARIRKASAVALPFRDETVDAVITDPPYYNMIDYADVSDLLYVWLKRCLFDVMPDLFGDHGLQDKTDEIIVKNGGGAGEHRTREFYERMLARAFSEARRVLRPDGHLVVVFGHSDPDAWLRLLGALRDAGFVVTSSWPSRTETAATGVASIKVTITIACRVAPAQRPVATVAQVDREAASAVGAAVRRWDADGLALTDQLMAAYGPAMEVYGRYHRVLLPNGEQAGVERYLTLARTAVRDATALKLDELPLETFDAPTRFAIFWQRLYGRTDVPKGEARFLAQADNLRLEELRGALLSETKSGFKLRIDAPADTGPRASSFEVVRAMASAWDTGGTEAVAGVLVNAGRQANDAHLWAVVAEIVRQVPASDPVGKALAAVQRNGTTIAAISQHLAAPTSHHAQAQLELSFEGDQQ